jgi:hypothetical protein
MKLFMMTSLAVASLAAFQPASQAQSQCATHEAVTQALDTRFQESRQALGLSGDAYVVELFVSERGSWTLTTTNTSGMTCVVATGEAWQQTPMKVAGLDS